MSKKEKRSLSNWLHDVIEERKESYPHSASLRGVSVRSSEKRKEKKKRKETYEKKTARERKTETNVQYRAVHNA